MKQPNLLVVMADQLAAPALPCYGPSVVKAPHLDRLAAEGVLFERAYCNSPLCAPSRASMMSGRLPSKIGAYDNAAAFASSVATVAHGLRAQGYWTCLAGKMHFVGPDQLHGFEDRLTPDIYPADFGWTPDWDHPEERIDWWYHNMLSVKQAGIAEATNQLDFDDETGFHALRFLKDYRRAADPRPFFLVVSFTHPHDPYATREATAPLRRRRDPTAQGRPAAARAPRPAQPPPAHGLGDGRRRPHRGRRPPRAPRLLRLDLLSRRPPGRAARDAAPIRPRRGHHHAVHLRPRRPLGRAGPVVQDALLRMGRARPADRPRAGPLRSATQHDSRFAARPDADAARVGQAAGTPPLGARRHEPGAAAGRVGPRRIAPCSANISPRARSRRSS